MLPSAIVISILSLTRLDVLSAMSVLSVSVNAGIIVFTMSILDQWTTEGKYWIFFGFQATCFCLKVLRYTFKIILRSSLVSQLNPHSTF